MKTPASPPDRVLLKLRPSGRLSAAGPRARLRFLFPGAQAEDGAFALGGEPQWSLADVGDGADTAWDLAHDRIADRLGIEEGDVLFAEPDLVHHVFPDPLDPPGGFAAGPRPAVEDCEARRQNTQGGQAVGPSEQGWHLDNAFSQQERARSAVTFTDPRPWRRPRDSSPSPPPTMLAD